nr:hypothetical protein [Tanacetum cinerariifolium]
MAPSIQSLSNASLLERLSYNIFIANFPTSVSAKDLWSTCKQFGTVMDVYIPLKLSKLGKRFAFARLKRDDTSHPVPKPSTFSHPLEHTQNGSKKSFASILKDPKVGMCKEDPVMVLEQDPLEYDDGLVLMDPLEYDDGLVLMGCVKEFESLPNIHIACSNEGFSGLKFSYLGGFWIMIDFVSSQSCMKFKSHEDWLNDKDAEVVEDSLPHQVPIISGDPFGLNDLIFNQPKNKEGVLPNKAQSGASSPPGFTPLNSNHESPVMECASNIPSHIQGLKSADINSLGEGFLDLFPNISGLILHRNVSDHRPILLQEFTADYGPTLFRLYHSWFLEEDFCVVLQETWNMDGQSSQNHIVRLKNKLKALKQRLKAWSSKKKQLINKDRLLIQKSLIDIDLRLDQGVLKEGDWIDNPTCVKTEFFHHFSNRFSLPDWSRIPLVDQFPSLLSLELANDMEVDVTSDEIKKAVWDCG